MTWVGLNECGFGGGEGKKEGGEEEKGEKERERGERREERKRGREEERKRGREEERHQDDEKQSDRARILPAHGMLTPACPLLLRATHYSLLAPCLVGKRKACEYGFFNLQLVLTRVPSLSRCE